MSFWTKKPSEIAESVTESPVVAVAEAAQDIEEQGESLASATSKDSAREVVGKGVRFRGDLFFDAPTRVNGNFRGVYSSTSSLYVARSAVMKGRLAVKVLVVEGIVESEVCATEKVEVLPGGVLRGPVLARTIVVHEGAEIEGVCRIGRAFDEIEAVEVPQLPYAVNG